MIYAVMAVLAVLASVAASISIFMMVLSKRLAPDALLFYVVAFLGSIAYGFSGRDLSNMAELADLSSETLAGRLTNVISLGICLVAVVKVTFEGVASGRATILALVTLQYIFVCFLMPAAFDPWFVYDHKLLYPIAALIIIVMPIRLDLRGLAHHFARAASIPAGISLILIAFNYNAVVRTDYASIIPFFTGRLYGATPHSNVLGPICTFAILLLTTYPPRRRWEFWGLLLINATALLLCQSKTSWITLILTMLIVNLPRFSGFRGRIPSFAYVALFVGLAIVPAALSVLDRSAYNFWAGNQTLADMGTLTGRTDIWAATLYLIRSHLITGFGYGSYLVYMQSLFPSLIPNPHNLYLATLVEAGIVGLVSLAAYIFAIILLAVGLQGTERRFALAYVALICIRGMSESFSFQQAFTAPVFWTLLMFLRLVAVMTVSRKQEMPEALPGRP